jgi:FAD binding domain/D-arabinono-1,4-lactone oxidase
MSSKKLESTPTFSGTINNKTDIRKTWKNCVENQVVEPLKLFTPGSLEELIEIIRSAEKNNCKVRAVGSGHSFSDILQTTDYLVNCKELKSVINLDGSLLKSQEEIKQNGFDPELLVQVENGITIKDLNQILDKKNLALYNMGGYDAQTIAGVISTATHGTGVTLGPISDQAVSIIMVGEDGIIYRIEPANGITDPLKYKAAFPDNKLIQDNNWFNTVSVSLGCTGIIYSVILKVLPAYYLKEERLAKVHETFWEDLKTSGSIKKMLNENRHFEVWINPYKIDGQHRCLVTKRNIFTGDLKKLPAGSRMRHWFIELILPFIEGFIRLLFKYFFKNSPSFINASMKQVIDYDGYIDKSFEVMHLGNANKVKGFSSEFAISLNDDLFIKAADKILELAEKNRTLGQFYHSAPISLRFVKKSKAFLAMMNGEDKCMIEVPVLVGTHGGPQILERIESELLKLGKIRPHWGQYNHYNAEIVKQLYPDLDKWLAVFRQLNKKGTFENEFSERCGLKKNNAENL